MQVYNFGETKMNKFIAFSEGARFGIKKLIVERNAFITAGFLEITVKHVVDCILREREKLMKNEFVMLENLKKYPTDYFIAGVTTVIQAAEERDIAFLSDTVLKNIISEIIRSAKQECQIIKRVDETYDTI